MPVPDPAPTGLDGAGCGRPVAREEVGGGEGGGGEGRGVAERERCGCKGDLNVA